MASSQTMKAVMGAREAAAAQIHSGRVTIWSRRWRMTLMITDLAIRGTSKRLSLAWVETKGRIEA
jgi:hypothetical protein